MAEYASSLLREDAALQSLVSTKYGDLVGAGKKPEKAETKKYDELEMEEFLAGCMGLLRNPGLPSYELMGRIALLEYTCNKLARYDWTVVRSFHAAAVKQALRKPGSWSDDWVALKEIYFDADPLKIKPAGSAASRQPKESNPPRICYRFSKNECAADTCRFDHICDYCWKKTSQRFQHSAADCHRKQAEEKLASSADNGANVKSSSE
ncbi:hypothetical protein Bbelb_126040 [Branchiostoma belcheri]|nr:hypothetical protein Bbelb_126040 [Branchiostoma belcheri]